MTSLGKPAFTVSNEKKELELVNVSAVELGLMDGAPQSDIYDRAKKLGLDLCPAEVGPQVALQFGSQLKNGEWLLIGMEPIIGRNGYHVFFVKRQDDGGLWLDTRYVYLDFVWHGGNRFVFLRRKSSK